MKPSRREQRANDRCRTYTFEQLKYLRTSVVRRWLVDVQMGKSLVLNHRYARSPTSSSFFFLFSSSRVFRSSSSTSVILKRSHELRLVVFLARRMDLTSIANDFSLFATNSPLREVSPGHYSNDRVYVQRHRRACPRLTSIVLRSEPASRLSRHSRHS